MHLTPPTKRVLFVSYLFPPTGGVGVSRVVKFVKYLPDFGWNSSVLTVSNPSVPLRDESFCREIPETTIVRRARTLEPGYALKNVVSASQRSAEGHGGVVTHAIKSLARRVGNAVLQPDAQILWKRQAVRAGLRLLKQVPHDAIVATAPPFSSFLVGARLSRLSGLPLILDYRDEWDISNAYWENKQPSCVSHWIQSRMQADVVRAASAILATTQRSADAVARVAIRAGSTAEATHIYNGYDPADFPAATTLDEPFHDKYRLAYVGTLWNLNSVEPLVRAVEELAQTAPHLAERLELVFAGRRTGPQEELLRRLDPLPCTVDRREFLNHDAAVELMRSANGLCLLQSDVPHADRIVSAKVFEYLAAHRTILALAPAGEVAEILAECPHAHVWHPNDVGAVVKTLESELERHQHRIPVTTGLWNPSAYDRRNQAGELATLLDGICLRRPSAGVHRSGGHGVNDAGSQLEVRRQVRG